LAQVAEYEVRRALLKLLHDLRGIGRRARPEEQVTVLGHEHIAEDFKTQFRPEIIQGLDKLALEATRVKNVAPRFDWA